MSGPKKKILVTGASGLLGLNFALHSCEAYEIVGVVNRNLLQELCLTLILSYVIK